MIRISRAIGIFLAGLVVIGTAGIAPAFGLKMGVTTHFSQGWPPALLADASQIHAVSIRDSLHWRSAEPTRGAYVFTTANSGHIARACVARQRVLLGLDPRNPLYDNGQTAFSPEARHAFAAYVRAIADHFGPCVLGAEIGNEINGANGMTGPAADNRPAAYTALLRDVYQAVKPGHPDFQVLGGSTNAIGTGFLDRLFDAGSLAYMDGVVVHPYRSEPASVDLELSDLADAIRRHGTSKPIWATEFSDDTRVDADAADYLLKMITLMSAAGVEHVYWYALIDQPAFPNMGLFDRAGAMKPGGRAFLYAASNLSNKSAERLAKGDGTIFLYRFGADRFVLWGAPRTFDVEGQAVYRDAEGRPIGKPALISDRPVIIEGDVAIRFGPSIVLADSLYGYRRPPWSYFAHPAGRAAVPLALIDGRFGSYLGASAFGRVTVTQAMMAAGGTPALPIPTTVRFTAPWTMPIEIEACVGRKTPDGGARLQVLHDGRPIHDAPVTGSTSAVVMPLSVAAGDTLDFTLMPSTAGPSNSQYRVRILRSAATPPPC